MLGLSKHTVRTYLSRIFLRCDVKDRVELVIHVFVAARGDGHASDCPHK